MLCSRRHVRSVLRWFSLFHVFGTFATFGWFPFCNFCNICNFWQLCYLFVKIMKMLCWRRHVRSVLRWFSLVHAFGTVATFGWFPLCNFCNICNFWQLCNAFWQNHEHVVLEASSAQCFAFIFVFSCFSFAIVGDFAFYNFYNICNLWQLCNILITIMKMLCWRRHVRSVLRWF